MDVMATGVMECKQRAMYAVGIICLVFPLAFGDLNVAKEKNCGQITCGYAEFCSPIDHTCKSCRKICDEGHNQEILMCNKNCQDYIHDMRYEKRGDNFGNYGEKEQVQKLQVISTISLIVSLIVFVCLVFLILTLWLNKKTKLNIFKLTSQAKKKKNEKADITRKDDLGQMNGMEISTIRVPEDKLATNLPRNDPHSPQMDFSTLTTTFKNYHARSDPDSVSSVYTNKSTRTAQPLAVRLPSEDSTLDFIYDNPALAPSPTLEKENNKEERKSTSNDT